MKENQKAIRLSAYVLGVWLLSLILEAVAKVLGQFMIWPVEFPLLMFSLFIHDLGGGYGPLDINLGPFAAFPFRGLARGLFWGGCIAYPMDMFRRTKEKRYKIILLSLGVYTLLTFIVVVVYGLLLANSGGID